MHKSQGAKSQVFRKAFYAFLALTTGAMQASNARAKVIIARRFPALSNVQISRIVATADYLSDGSLDD